MARLSLVWSRDVKWAGLGSLSQASAGQTTLGQGAQVQAWHNLDPSKPCLGIGEIDVFVGEWDRLRCQWDSVCIQNSKGQERIWKLTNVNLNEWYLRLHSSFNVVLIASNEFQVQ